MRAEKKGSSRCTAGPLSSKTLNKSARRVKQAPARESATNHARPLALNSGQPRTDYRLRRCERSCALSPLSNSRRGRSDAWAGGWGRCSPFGRGAVSRKNFAQLCRAGYGFSGSRHKCEHNSRTALIYIAFLHQYIPCAVVLRFSSSFAAYTCSPVNHPVCHRRFAGSRPGSLRGLKQSAQRLHRRRLHHAGRPAARCPDLALNCLREASS